MGFDDDQKQAARLNLTWKPNDDVQFKVGLAFTHVGGIGPGYNFNPILDPRLRTALEDHRLPDHAGPDRRDGQRQLHQPSLDPLAKVERLHQLHSQLRSR